MSPDMTYPVFVIKTRFSRDKSDEQNGRLPRKRESKEDKRVTERKGCRDLAHYYVDGAVQEIADYVGDSFYLSKVATSCRSRIFCLQA